MRLLKKLFSIGSRKSRKQSAADPCSGSVAALPAQEHLKPSQTDNTEEEVCRLLRSSSGRLATGLGSLSPLPHPIDSVIPHPKSSTATLASVSARSTYSVTLHGRTVHSRTEFPNACPPMDFTPQRSLTDSVRRRSKSVPITPRDKSRLSVLRQDPSVASLLNYYDDQGHLNSAVFSNSPSPRKEGVLQRRHTGSTLRQLLGHPSSPELRNGSTEGDISWAEKFLRETDGNSSVSSIGPQTPADTHFSLTHSIDDKSALSTECDTQAADHPTFSSLEVELSVSTDQQALNLPHGNSLTPQRASQVFEFLGDKKRVLAGPVSRLPQLKTTASPYRRFSAESPISDTKSYIPLPRRSNTHIPQLNSPVQRRFSIASEVDSSLPSQIATVFLSLQPEGEEPTTIVSQHTRHSSRGPRGPRLPSKIPSRQNTGPLSISCDFDASCLAAEQLQSALPEKSGSDNKYHGVTVTRQREMQSQIPKLRSPSGSSTSSTESKLDGIVNSRRSAVPLQSTIQVKLGSIEADLEPDSRENDMSSRLPQLVTPVRSFALASHVRSPSSPASSSELSPVAKQMMADLRQLRMDARQRERRAGRLGSGQSRIRY